MRRQLLTLSTTALAAGLGGALGVNILSARSAVAASSHVREVRTAPATLDPLFSYNLWRKTYIPSPVMPIERAVHQFIWLCMQIILSICIIVENDSIEEQIVRYKLLNAEQQAPAYLPQRHAG